MTLPSAAPAKGIAMIEFLKSTDELGPEEARGAGWLHGEVLRQLAERGVAERFQSVVQYGRRQFGGSAGIPRTVQTGYLVRITDCEREEALTATCFVPKADATDADRQEATSLILRLWLDRALPG
ncbi:MAG: hypothetical protein HY320_13885 [Armatimonadetes bacterium]|nr:hypothetical protein [Armatimonadota bacterium]